MNFIRQRSASLSMVVRAVLMVVVLVYWILDRRQQLFKIIILVNAFLTFGLFFNMLTLVDVLKGVATTDYVYLAFTTSFAFSPTDALPLTRRAKLLMLLQSAISMITLTAIASSAINIMAGGS